MKRRKFLMAGLASAASPMIFARSKMLKNNKNNPIILSTWNFGLPANEVASKVLSEGGNAMDAAEAGARHAESDEENNSVGYGGLPDENGNVTLDACVMDSSGNAGSVAFIQNIKHPVSVARKVMEETKHVMLVGEGARQFAISKGFQEIDLLTEKSENEWKKWLTTLNEIARRVSENAAVSWEVLEPEGLINRAPSLVISWKPDQLHITGNEIAENFAQTSPRIAIGSFDRDGHSSISINPSQMQPGNKNVVIERLCETLNTKRCKRPTDLKDATADVDGEWAVTVNYFTSTSNHRWNLRQDGNWIEGRHESDQSIQDICGTVEGSSVTLRSVFNQPGDSIDFIFSGTVTNSTIEGSIHLGEYLSATFTAIHHPEIHVRQRINVPSGPPLAT